MSTAASLSYLISIRADITHYTNEEIYYSTLDKANQAKVDKYAKYETAWEKAYDECYSADSEKPKKVNGTPYTPGNEAQAEAYANAKVSKRNEELYLELCDLDIEYESIMASIDTTLEELRADEESAKQNTQGEAQDTHLLGN